MTDLSRASVGGAYCCDGVGCRPRMEDLGLGGFVFFIFFTAFSIPKDRRQSSEPGANAKCKWARELNVSGRVSKVGALFLATDGLMLYLFSVIDSSTLKMITYSDRQLISK